jgi:hypothetical protein
VSPAVAGGHRAAVPGSEGLSIWLPDEWEVVDEDQLFELLALGPSEEPYRANVSVLHISVDAGLTLEAIADSTARLQAQNLDTFVEYDRRPATLAGAPAVQREYAWVQGGTSLVLYQVELLALTGDGRALEIHATSAAPAYFRYAALLRRILESIERAP